MQAVVPSAEWNLQILKLLLWWVYATGCPVLRSKRFISCSYIMHQCHPFIINTNWHNKRLNFMQMSHDAIGGLFTTVVVTVALAKRSFLSAVRGSAALCSVASCSLRNEKILKNKQINKDEIWWCINFGLPLHFPSHLFPKLLQSVQSNGLLKMYVVLSIASSLCGQNIFGLFNGHLDGGNILSFTWSQH